MPYERERMAAVEAVLTACRLCRAVQQSLVTEDSIAKKDRSPVTVADFGSQAVVSSFLAETFPDIPLVAEEDSGELMKPENSDMLERVTAHVRGVTPEFDDVRIIKAINRGNHPGGSDRFWTLDPIDGTKGFLRHEQYAVALALMEDGRPVLGVLGCPNLHIYDYAGQTVGRMFVAVQGEGTFERGLDDDKTEWKIRVDEIVNPAAARFCESVESGHSSHDDASRVGALLGITSPSLRMDSQCKYGIVARGEASIYLRLPVKKFSDPQRHLEKIWDHAAGALIVEEAGGMASDVFGKHLDFSRGRELSGNAGVIVTNRHLHDRVLKAVQQVLGI
jgi:3'(2'), 5'-bisphosphate nucleotidase